MAMFHITVKSADGAVATRAVEADSREAAIAGVGEGNEVLKVAEASPSLAARLAALRLPVRKEPSVPVARGHRVAAAVLVALPLATAFGALLLLMRTEGQVVRMAQSLAARPPMADRASVGAIMGREPVSVTIARVARRLPANAALHAIARDRNGALTLEIDAVDPEAVRSGLSIDPVLAGLVTAGETMVPDRGLRMRLMDAR